ncbi:MAG TPA: type II toxin-antitoxin system RelE/ParE family toxin [Rhizobiaceae bacterium]|nr:type II toxin-antitoxin system RelE/ParE family toxin [Rhizobiaceae bacterium]
MPWTIEYSDTALKHLKKLDRAVARRIVEYMDKRIAPIDDPRSAGKALIDSLKGLWRYRQGDWRILRDIQDARVVVLVLEIGHRSNVYE